MAQDSADVGSEFVDVYRKDTGEKVSIPKAWVDTGLMDSFRKTPKPGSTGGDNSSTNTEG